MFRLTALCAGLLLSANALALSLADLSQNDASSGLKDALTQGAQIAVRQQPAGRLQQRPGRAHRTARQAGQSGEADEAVRHGRQVDQLEASMNRAAEAAVPQAQGLLVEAVKKMTVADAKGILKGGDDAATEYLDKSSREQLRAKFLPIVKQATDEVGLVKQYNAFASQAATLGVVDAKSANVEGYVTEQALDGLFEMIARQEKSIRQNPAAAATGLAKKVFGAAR